MKKIKAIFFVALMGSIGFIWVGCSDFTVDPLEPYPEFREAIPFAEREIPKVQTYTLYYQIEPNDMYFVAGKESNYPIKVNTLEESGDYEIKAFNLPDGASLFKNEDKSYSILWLPSHRMINATNPWEKIPVRLDLYGESKETGEMKRMDSKKINLIVHQSLSQIEIIDVIFKVLDDNNSYRVVEEPTLVNGQDSLSITVLVKNPDVPHERVLLSDYFFEHWEEDTRTNRANHIAFRLSPYPFLVPLDSEFRTDQELGSHWAYTYEFTPNYSDSQLRVTDGREHYVRIGLRAFSYFSAVGASDFKELRIEIKE